MIFSLPLSVLLFIFDWWSWMSSVICLSLFFGGLIFTTRGGIYWIDLGTWRCDVVFDMTDSECSWSLRSPFCIFYHRSRGTPLCFVVVAKYSHFPTNPLVFLSVNFSLSEYLLGETGVTSKWGESNRRKPVGCAVEICDTRYETSSYLRDILTSDLLFSRKHFWFWWLWWLFLVKSFSLMVICQRGHVWLVGSSHSFHHP